MLVCCAMLSNGQINIDSLPAVWEGRTKADQERQNEYEKKLLEYRVAYEKQLVEHQRRNWRERFAFLGGAALLVLSFGLYLRKIRNRNAAERKKLLRKIELLEKRVAAQSVSSSEKREEHTLDKAKIEKAINAKLGESAWAILNLISENPSISNKQIAKEVSLSLEGVSSSLRRMYAAFHIKSSSNKKILLIMEAVRISMEEEGGSK